MDGTTAAILRDPIIEEGATTTVSLAALLLDARFAVLRFADGHVISSDEQAAPAAEEVLSDRAARSAEPLVVFTADELSEFAGVRRCAVVPLRNGDGTFIGTLTILDGAARDINWTDRQILMKLGTHVVGLLDAAALVDKSASQLRRLEALLDAIPVAAYLVESERLVYVNAKFARTLGYTKAKLMEMSSATGLIISEEQNFVREIIRRREAGDHHDVRYITQVRCRNGTILDTEVHGSIVNIDGRRSLIGAAVDISDHARERKRVQEREEYFRTLTENASDVIAILDEAGTITYITPSAQRILGLTPEELIGTEYKARIHPDDRKQFDAVSTTAYRFRCKNGSWRSLESVGTDLLRHPLVRGVVLNTRDITDRKVLEEQVEQLHRLTSLGRLAAEVAHEFNNVLMGIQPAAEILRRRHQDDPNLSRLLESIASSIARGKRITTDILRFGRPAVPTLQTVDIGELIRQTSNEIRSMLPETIALETGVTDAPIFAHADAAQISQVLINLALNARDAMRSTGGTLKIAARRSDQFPGPKGHDFVHLSVSDTGEGIENEHLAYIFEPLFTTKKTGTGLGLSVVWQIVTAHRGHVSVESERGMGTTFHVHIPATVSRVEQRLPQNVTALSRRVNAHILLVEDEAAIADGLRWSLEAEGFSLDVAATVKDAIRTFAENPADIVILDLSLPDGDGRTVYDRISSIVRVPVIFSSGHTGEGDIEDLLNKPRTAFLMKPYSTDDLFQAINRLLEEHGFAKGTHDPHRR